MKGFARFVLDSVLPLRCVSCDTPTGGRLICKECSCRLVRAGEVVGGGHLRVIPPWYECEVFVSLVRFMKFEGGRAAAGILGAAMASALAAAGARHEKELLVPVPLHWTRLARRGFDQAELLASEVSRRSGIPVARRALVRRRKTRAQSTLDEDIKRVNVRGAFRARKKSVISGRDVILVDDLVTTGETVSACAEAVRVCSPASVSVLSAGRRRGGKK